MLIAIHKCDHCHWRPDCFSHCCRRHRLVHEIPQDEDCGLQESLRVGVLTARFWSAGTKNKAEAKLATRETRVEAMTLRELAPAERERFISEWQTVQSRFVDHPKSAVTEADGPLINGLLLARVIPRQAFSRGRRMCLYLPAGDGGITGWRTALLFDPAKRTQAPRNCGQP